MRNKKRILAIVITITVIISLFTVITLTPTKAQETGAYSPDYLVNASDDANANLVNEVLLPVTHSFGDTAEVTRDYDSSTEEVTFEISGLQGDSGAIYFDTDKDGIADLQLGFTLSDTSDQESHPWAEVYKNVDGDWVRDTRYQDKDQGIPLEFDETTTALDRPEEYAENFSGKIWGDRILVELDVSVLGEDFKYAIRDSAVEGGNYKLDVSESGWDWNATNDTLTDNTVPSVPASDGDVIGVAPGTYQEDLDVDVEGLTLTSVGDARPTIDIESSTGPVVQINAPNVTFSGFEVKGAVGSGEGGQGIDVNGDSYNTDNVVLKDLEVRGNEDRAVVLDYTVNGTVKDTLIENNFNEAGEGWDDPEDDWEIEDDADGLVLWYSDECQVINVTARNNGDNGIYVHGDNTYLEDITTINNMDEGLDISNEGEVSGGVEIINLTALRNNAQAVEIEGNEEGTEVSIENAVLRGSPIGLNVLGNTEASISVSNLTFKENSEYQISDKSGKLDLEEVLDENEFDKAVVIKDNGEIKNGEIYSSIQAAIEEAESGDVIEVYSGTYEESVTIDKSLTLVSREGPEETVIEGKISIESDEVTFDGFTVSPTTKFTSKRAAAIFVNGNNVLVENNIVEGVRGDGSVTIHGIQVFKQSNPRLENIEILNNVIRDISNKGSGADGIKVQNQLNDVDVCKNTIKDIHSAGWSYGITVTPSSDHTVQPEDVSVLRNHIEGISAEEFSGVAFGLDTASGDSESGSPADASEVEVHYNNLTAPVGAINKDLDTTLNATLNYWDSNSGPSHSSNTYNVVDQGAKVVGDVDYTPWLVKPGCSSFSPVFNNDTGVGYPSIQTAVNDANEKEIVSVKDGTYTETINITNINDFTLKGTKDARLIPKTTQKWGPKTSFPKRESAIKVINSSNIIFKSLEVDFSEVNNNLPVGMVFWDSSGSIINSTFKNMSSEGPIDLVSYFGTSNPSESRFSPSNRATIKIINNKFIEYGRIGVNFEDFTRGIIAENTFKTTDAGYAIEVGSEATGKILNNKINSSTTRFYDGSRSACIYIENAYSEIPGINKGVKVKDNSIKNSHYGIFVGNEWSSKSNDVDIKARIVNNHIFNNEVGGIGVTDSGANNGSSVTVISDQNILENNSKYGYHIFEGSKHSPEGDGDISVKISEDRILNSEIGIYLNSTELAPIKVKKTTFKENNKAIWVKKDSSAKKVELNKNNIFDSNEIGVLNDNSTILSAELNYWGHPSGPTREVPGRASKEIGKGAKVYGEVLYKPWLPKPPEEVNDKRYTISTRKLEEGWNTFSVPMRLSENSLIGDIIPEQETDKIVQVISYDSSENEWVDLGGSDRSDALEPMDAVYIYVTDSVVIDLSVEIQEGDIKPPEKELSSGWNLVGPSPENIFNPCPVNKGFVTNVEGVSLIGSVYPNDEPWTTYTPGQENQDKVEKEVYPFKGYWVYMDKENDVPGRRIVPPGLNKVAEMAR